MFKSIVLCVFVAMSLSACVGGISAVNSMLAVGTVSFVETKKLPTDHLAEMSTGQDCSLVRAQEDGGPICRSLTKDFVRKPLYCYNELGRVTCYERDDPYYSGIKSTLVQ